jgi:hypothetical protein
MFRWVKGLLKLRASRAELSVGEEQVLQAKSGTMLFVRGKDLKDGCAGGRQRIIVAVNNSSNAEEIETSIENTSLAGCHEPELLWGKDATVTLDREKLRLNAGAKQSFVIAVR